MKRFGGESLVLCSFCCQGFGKVPTVTVFLLLSVRQSGGWLYRQAFSQFPQKWSCSDMHRSSKTPSCAISSCQHLEYSTSLQHSCSPGATGPAVGFLWCFPPLTTLPATAEPQRYVKNVEIFTYVWCFYYFQALVWHVELTGYSLVFLPSENPFGNCWTSVSCQDYHLRSDVLATSGTSLAWGNDRVFLVDGAKKSRYIPTSKK